MSLIRKQTNKYPKRLMYIYCYSLNVCVIPSPPNSYIEIYSIMNKWCLDVGPLEVIRSQAGSLYEHD